MHGYDRRYNCSFEGLLYSYQYIYGVNLRGCARRLCWHIGPRGNYVSHGHPCSAHQRNNGCFRGASHICVMGVRGGSVVVKFDILVAADDFVSTPEALAVRLRVRRSRRTTARRWTRASSSRRSTTRMAPSWSQSRRHRAALSAARIRSLSSTSARWPLCCRWSVLHGLVRAHQVRGECRRHRGRREEARPRWAQQRHSPWASFCMAEPAESYSGRSSPSQREGNGLMTNRVAYKGKQHVYALCYL